jgi:hypothetical protein
MVQEDLPPAPCGEREGLGLLFLQVVAQVERLGQDQALN